MQLKDIYIYPIKALGGIRVEQAKLETRGLQNDRRYMLTTIAGEFMTQRTVREMALFRTAIRGNEILVWRKGELDNVLTIPMQPTTFIQEQTVEVWGLESICQVMPKAINEWFQDQLKMDCQLVYMPDNAERRMKEKYNKARDLVSFADGAPILIIGQAGLDDLNSRLEKPVMMNRFRPNLVFTGGAPFEEDNWQKLQVGKAHFKITHRCERCNVPNINQETALIDKEPNRTLAKFRRFDRAIYVGVTAVWEAGLSNQVDEIRVGDEIVRSVTAI